MTVTDQQQAEKIAEFCGMKGAYVFLDGAVVHAAGPHKGSIGMSSHVAAAILRRIAERDRLRQAVHGAAHESHTDGRIFALNHPGEGITHDAVNRIDWVARKHIDAALVDDTTGGEVP